MNKYLDFENKFFDGLNRHLQNRPSIDCYKELLNLEPNNSILLYLLSHAYFLNNDIKNSEKYYQKAITINSNIDFQKDYSNINDIIKFAFGTLSSKQNPFRDEKIEKTLNFQPVFDSVYSNSATLYRCYNDLSNSRRVCEDGLKTYPNSRFIKWIYGGTLLKTRFIEKGWDYFDDRTEEFYHLPEEFKQKEFYNFQKTDKPVYVYYSGGLGDTIFMARYLPLFEEKNIKIICEPQKSMQRLFKASGFSYKNREDIKASDFDYRISFLNLSGLFKTTIDSIPYPDEFLKADDNDIQEYKTKFFVTNKKKVGIIWNTGKNDTIRKIDLKNFIKLFENNKEYQFYSLQHEITDEERQILKDYNVINIGENFTDWEDTAAALSNLDLYFGCDTSVSNLAGALGIKSYILVLDFCEWRWGTYEETTPWFNSTTVYRQKEHGDWTSVINRLQNVLNENK